MLVAAVVAVAVLAPTAEAAGGRVNPQIAGLQVALRAHGLYLGPIDGISGPRTAAGLHRFQRHVGLRTGVADARTRRALGPLGHPLFGSRQLHRGQFGWDVSVLQFVLARAGYYDGALDGYLDGLTANALRRYQRAVHLAPDGVLGPHTLVAFVRRDAVPVRAPTPTSAASLVYVVQSGDSLTSIATRFHTTVKALASANKLDPHAFLLIGKRLRVPAARAPVALTASSAEVRALLDAWSGRLGVDPKLVRALAWMESGYQTRLVSSAGARGVLQLLPSTRKYVEENLLHHEAPHTVSGDVETGVALLGHLLGAFDGNRKLALAAWYQGERAVREQGIFKVSKPFVANVLALQTRM
jgi:LysM repeat protein